MWRLCVSVCRVRATVTASSTSDIWQGVVALVRWIRSMRHQWSTRPGLLASTSGSIAPGPTDVKALDPPGKMASSRRRRSHWVGRRNTTTTTTSSVLVMAMLIAHLRQVGRCYILGALHATASTNTLVYN